MNGTARTGLLRGTSALFLCASIAGCGERAEKPFTGYMEAELLLVGAEQTGRIVSLAVDEGGSVRPGQTLFVIDDRTSRAETEQALARVSAAEARVADTRASVQTPADIAVLESARERAEAAAILSSRDYDRHRTLARRGFVSQALLDEKRAAMERDAASLTEARRRIAQGRQPGRPDEIEAAEATLSEARAASREASIDLGKSSVASPAAGSVEQVFFRAGEVVAAGQPVVALLPPERLKVRFFVPETLLAEARIGRIVTVACDSCPANLTARIGFVSRDAEFTPPIILSQGERERLVFLVEAVPLGATGGLAAGQPIEVSFADDR